jgi:hypothetical protein
VLSPGASNDLCIWQARERKHSLVTAETVLLSMLGEYQFIQTYQY